MPRLIGGWRDHLGESLRMAREIGLGMAATHLLGGHDVVPQFTGRPGEIERFEAVARDSGAGDLTARKGVGMTVGECNVGPRRHDLGGES